MLGYFHTAENGQLLGQIGITTNNGSWIKDTNEYNLRIPTPNPIVNETIFLLLF